MTQFSVAMDREIGEPTISSVVFCPDCECPRALTFDSGSLACSSCGSGNWMPPPSNVTTRFHQCCDGGRDHLGALDGGAAQQGDTFLAPDTKVLVDRRSHSKVRLLFEPNVELEF